DDAAQGIEEVVRGDDLLLSTPRQLYLVDLLGLPRPSHAHVPLVLGPEGTRLAKRDGAVTLADRRAAGQEPDAVRAWLAASLGLAEPGEPVTAAQLVERFDPDVLPRGPWRLTSADLAG
ncbi:MAG: tRNA glutamyl-Q(34) synthetase GluQRS, partial [Acidimicrobiales bacterium]|nr:tRNA glutamyl-Q(34) synthetase GluQRS [Acidimicrobiales bacterium]